MRTLTYQELEELRKLSTNERDRLLLETQYQTGCTVNELINIKKTDITSHHIRITNRTTTVSKNLTEQLISFSQHTQSEYVFSSRQSNQLTQKRIQQITKQQLKKLHIPLDKETPHLLRYTHIAHAIQQHISFKAIMQQTGLKELRLSQIITELQTPQDEGYGRMFK